MEDGHRIPYNDLLIWTSLLKICVAFMKVVVRVRGFFAMPFQRREAVYWVAAEEFELSYHNSDIILSMLYIHILVVKNEFLSSNSFS